MIFIGQQTYGSLPAILIIIMTVSMLMIFETGGMLFIADSEDALTGRVYDESGQIIFGSSEVSSDKQTQFTLIPAQKEYCTGEKSYHTYYVTIVPEQDYKIEETELYQKLKSGVYCEVRQQIKNPDGTFIKGGFYPLQETVFMGTTAFSAGARWFIPMNAGDYVIWNQAKCADSTRIWSVSDISFTAKKCVDADPIDELIKECDTKDTSYCDSGYLYVKDYSYLNNVCSPTTKYEVNDACKTQYYDDYCGNLGLLYDIDTGKCVNPPVITPPGEPSEPEEPGIDVPGEEGPGPILPGIPDISTEEVNWFEENKPTIIIGSAILLSVLFILGILVSKK